MTSNRPCLECGLLIRSTTSRCGPCQKTKDRTRNQTRAQYRGGWKAFSEKQRRHQPWCSVCGAMKDLTFDHEHWRVECKSCNSSHRRNRAG
jgi:hypothetical protein